MTSDHDNGGAELPGDPFVSYDGECIAREEGGQVTGRIIRNSKDRLTIGAYRHPHNMQSLNLVTIRMYRDGKQTETLNLGDLEVQEVFRALHEAVAVCWPSEPDPPLTPRTDWDALPDDSDSDDDGGDPDPGGP